MRTIFTKALYAIVILALFATTSCKKDGGSSSSGYYVKFKLNGTQKQYSETTAAVFTDAFSVHQCSMVGEETKSASIYEGMAISIYSDAAIAANVTYTDQIVASLGTPQATLLFTDSDGTQTTSAFLSNANVKVTITQMDDKTVTGTFSGNIGDISDISGNESITEGQFHLPRN